MSRNEVLWREISSKFDTLIALVKLIAKDSLTQLQKDISKDKTMSRVLEATKEEICYTELCTLVAKELKVSSRTVKTKVSRLREMGLVTAEKRGKTTYYTNSGLIS